MNEVVASLRGVHKRYGAQHALAGIDLELQAGQVLALLGPTGAGKTTSIGLLLGLLRADAGQVRQAIVSMPHYFAQYDTQVDFISAEELASVSGSKKQTRSSWGGVPLANSRVP